LSIAHGEQEAKSIGLCKADLQFAWLPRDWIDTGRLQKELPYLVQPDSIRNLKPNVAQKIGDCTATQATNKHPTSKKRCKSCSSILFSSCLSLHDLNAGEAASTQVPSSEMRTNLATLMDDFRRRPGEVAVVRHKGNRRLVTTYGELAHMAGCFAAELDRRGIVQGDRVLLWADNSAEWISAFHGCILRGVLAVPLDAHGSADFANRVAADVTPKLAVGDAVLLTQLSFDVPRIAFEDWPAALPREEAMPTPGLSGETPLQILFTSGTTGEPKGIVLTHGNVLASMGPIEQGAKPYMRYEWLVHPLRILHTLPLSHVFGQTMGLWIPPLLGAELHFEERLVAPRLVEMIRLEHISVLAAVPRVLALLKAHLELEYPGLAERLDGAKGISAARRWWRFRKVHRAFGLKFWAFVSGGGALSDPLEQFWNALGFVLIQGYGMTETTALITLNHPFHVARGTIGKPLAGREVKLGPDGEVLVRGASISGATWSGGKLHKRKNEWLPTGDIAEMASTGDLRFLGRKSEVIVTAAGLNVHPEDLEAVLEEQPGVAACAVVPMETTEGPEPCAVIAMRGSGERAAAAIEGANSHLADFQRLRRWVLWPEPDLPRTSTGKVRRKAVSEWLGRIQSASTANGTTQGHGKGAFGAAGDWLLGLISQITGETYRGVGDELRLTEDLHLDSLGRVQLAAAIEDRLGIVSEDGMLNGAETLGDLRRLIAGGDHVPQQYKIPSLSPDRQGQAGTEPASSRSNAGVSNLASTVERAHYVYPRWPWLLPFRWIRIFFIELVVQPLVWFLANPRVTSPRSIDAAEPMLIVANHVTAFDGPLVQYALPGAIRRRIAVAMSGEMLNDYRHFRNPEPLRPTGRLFLPGPLIYYLLTGLFNVFPLPRLRDFQPSFAHAGKALDHGYNVLVFPEGTRSAAGMLTQFRSGIGLLAKQSGARVLPVALRGVGELKAGNQRWFRSGKIEVRVGEPLQLSGTESEAAIAARLHDAVQQLLED
jgi:long-chain acyl-CoA synthetase